LIVTESTDGSDSSRPEECFLDETERHILRNSFPLETGGIDFRIVEEEILWKYETFGLPALSFAQ
jgi:hypothetical protein